MTDTATGPASYFPAIEAKYGQPVQHWIDLVAARPEETHTQTVTWLKTGRVMGHGHANAIVAHVRAQKTKG